MDSLSNRVSSLPLVILAVLTERLLENLIDDRRLRGPRRGWLSGTVISSQAGRDESCELEARSSSVLVVFQDIIPFPARRLARLRMLDVLELYLREALRTRSRMEPLLADEVLCLGEQPRSGTALGHLSLCRWTGCSG